MNITSNKMITRCSRYLLMQTMLRQQQKHVICRCLSSNALTHISYDEKTMDKRFIPMTRRTLIRKVMESSHLVGRHDHDQFVDFVNGLEASISKEFNGVLRELKVIKLNILNGLFCRFYDTYCYYYTYFLFISIFL